MTLGIITIQQRRDKLAFFGAYIHSEYKRDLFEDKTVKTVGPYPVIQSFDRGSGGLDTWFKEAYPKIKKVNDWLPLKPLSEISEGDAIQVGNIISSNFDEWIIGSDENHIRVSCNETEIGIWADGEILLSDNEQCPLSILEAYDYLRSQNYLVKFGQYSASEIIQMGWARIKE